MCRRVLHKKDSTKDQALLTCLDLSYYLLLDCLDSADFCTDNLFTFVFWRWCL